MENIIKKTKEYEIFKSIEGNRKVDKFHVASLANSIEKNNLLSIRPIIVDMDMYVLDGQHRLEAARFLGVEIFFIQTNSNEFVELSVLNQNNKNWKSKDFLNFYALNKKNENYINIIRMMATHEINLDEFFLYSEINHRKPSNVKLFKEGRYIFSIDEEVFSKNISFWRTFYEFLKEKGVPHCESCKSLVFKSALLLFLKSKRVNRDQFLEKIRGNVSLFFKCRNKDEYIDLFLRIYNFGISYKLEKGMLF